MSELLTYGSVGGVGRKPGPYPAANAGKRLGFAGTPWRGVGESERSAKDNQALWLT